LAFQNADNSATTQEENDASQDAFFRCEVTEVSIPCPVKTTSNLNNQKAIPSSNLKFSIIEHFWPQKEMKYKRDSIERTTTIVMMPKMKMHKKIK
jgi:hypothetical protein